MFEDVEASIAKTQAKAAQAKGSKGLDHYHNKSIGILNERTLAALLFFAIFGLMVLWALATSPLLLYGSLAGVFLLIIVWGVMRVKHQEALKRQRAQQIDAWQSSQSQSTDRENPL